MKLHYQSLGQGQPLLILHGLFGSSTNWRKLAQQLAESFRVITVDLRNHGLSPHSAELDYALMAEDLHELVNALALESIFLLGHSMGGKVAMQYADAHPQHLRKLVVVDIAPRRYHDEHTAIIDALLAIDLQRFNSRRQVDEALAAHIGDSMVRQFLLMNLETGDGRLRWRINLPALKANYANLLQAVCERGGIEVPTCFIRGSASNYITDQDWQLIQQRFYHAVLESVAGAGHWVHADKPAAFINITREFLHHD